MIYIFKSCIHVLNKSHLEKLNNIKFLQKIKKIYVPNPCLSESNKYILKKNDKTINDINKLKLVCLKAIRNDTGHENIIELSKLLSKQKKIDFEINIVGYDFTNNFINKINLANVSSYFVLHGNMEHNDALKLLEKMDMGILLSKAEMFPNFLVECLEQGIPIIGFNVQGVNDVIEDNKNGIISDYLDFKSMSDRIIGVFTNNSEYQKLSNGAFESSKNFSPLLTGKSHLSFYENILSN